MDNDVPGTEYAIGFSSAVTRARELINRQRTTLGSHERIGVFRIFGRDAGFSALYTAYVTSARCVIPEVPLRPRPAGRGPRPRTSGRTPRGMRLIITSEGAIWRGRGDRRAGRGRRLRPSPQGEHRRGARRRAARANRHRHGRVGADVRPAVGRARFPRFDGRHHLRERRDGPAGRRRRRPDGGAPRRQVRARCAAGPVAAEARRRRRRELQRRAVPAALRRPARASRCCSSGRRASTRWPGPGAEVGAARRPVSSPGPTARGSSAPRTTCPRRRGPGRRVPSRTARTVPTRAAPRRPPAPAASAMPRSLRWSATLKPSG